MTRVLGDGIKSPVTEMACEGSALWRECPVTGVPCDVSALLRECPPCQGNAM